MDILQSISVIIAAIFAIYSVNAWRRELKGQRELDVAEQALSLIYECKDNLYMIRSPLGYVGEGATRKRRDNETEKESRVLDAAYVLIERYEHVKGSFIKLQAIKYRFMALFGQDNAEPFNEVNKIMGKLFGASRRLGERYWNPNYQAQAKRDPKWYDKRAKEEAKFWAGQDPDIIAQQMDNAVAHVEDVCSKIIRRKSPRKKQIP
jgi:hypothetical protein